MSLYNSLSDLAVLTGWSPDTLLLLVAFFLAVYWIVSIIGLGLAIAIWIKAFGWFSKRRKK